MCQLKESRNNCCDVDASEKSLKIKRVPFRFHPGWQRTAKTSCILFLRLIFAEFPLLTNQFQAQPQQLIDNVQNCFSYNQLRLLNEHFADNRYWWSAITIRESVLHTPRRGSRTFLKDINYLIYDECQTHSAKVWPCNSNDTPQPKCEFQVNSLYYRFGL